VSVQTFCNKLPFSFVPTLCESHYVPLNAVVNTRP
jgi:hypothetical protein